MAVDRFTGRTAWARNLQTPLRTFLRTETGSAAVLLAASVAALVWVNVDASSYDDLWSTTLSVQLGDHGISQDLRDWVNNGLMTFFFFVIGLEARREFDMGELRERRRLALPRRGGHRRHGGAGRDLPRGRTPASRRSTAGARRCRPTPRSRSACSRSSGRGFPIRLRAFLLTVAVVDDLVALVVIARRLQRATSRWRRCFVAARRLRAAILAPCRPAGGRLQPRPRLRRCSGWPAWLALYESGVEPIVVRPGAGPAGLRLPAGPQRPGAGDRPLPALPRAAHARAGPRGARWSSPSAISPNERLQQAFHPWTSYVIVPLFALANAGVAIDGETPAARLHLADHARHPARLRRWASRSGSSAPPGW